MEVETLYCIKGHTYNGKWRTPGEAVEVRRRHSFVLIGLGRMSREPSNVIAFPAKSAVPQIPLQAAPTAPPEDLKGDEPKTTPEAVKSALRAEYKALFGKDAHGRTSVERLREEIDKKKGETQ